MTVSAQQVTWPVRSGLIPPLAECHIPRPETGHGLASNLAPGDVAVLVPGEAGRVKAANQGGTGKTQLAVGLAHALWESRSVDLMVWVSASNKDALLTGFAQALGDVGAGTAGEDPAAAAERFVGWLSDTDRPWLVVLDDLADPADLDGLWPHGAAGRVLVTSRTDDPALDAQNRRIVRVGAFTRRESLSYLSVRFNNDPDQRVGALDLAEDLCCLPLGLAQAAALMADRGLNCRDYRARFADRSLHVTLPSDDPVSAVVAVTWSLCIDRADQLLPGGLAWPTLVLASLLDPGGIPGAVITGPAACGYITGERKAAETAEAKARAAVYNLARLGLVTIDPSSAARTIRVARSVQAAVTTYLSTTELDLAARTAADALLQTWAAGDDDPMLAQALRDCTAQLSDVAGDVLWKPEGHTVFFRAGESREKAKLTESALAYWQDMADTSGKILGAGHPQTFLARGDLARAYQNAGQPQEAIPVYERTLAEREWAFGHYHPECLAARGELASAYRTAGRLDEAIPLYERTLADREGVLGANHLDTLASRGDLASAYRTAGRVDEAINLYKRTLADRERIQGADHPDTITARGNLAYAYHTARRLSDAIPLYERTLADCERVLGPDHPDTLTSRGNVGHAYHTAGRLTDAIKVFRRTLADSERVLGADHQLTQSVRENLETAEQT